MPYRAAKPDAAPTIAVDASLVPGKGARDGNRESTPPDASNRARTPRPSEDRRIAVPAMEAGRG